MPRTEAALQTASADLARRVPPHSVEAERAVLAGILLRPGVLEQVVPLLRKDDFYLPANQLVYAAALDLHERNAPVDLVSLAESLRDRSLLEHAGGAAYLADLAPVRRGRGQCRILREDRARQGHAARAHRGRGGHRLFPASTPPASFPP